MYGYNTQTLSTIIITIIIFITITKGGVWGGEGEKAARGSRVADDGKRVKTL